VRLARRVACCLLRVASGRLSIVGSAPYCHASPAAPLLDRRTASNVSTHCAECMSGSGPKWERAYVGAGLSGKL
jgi:hypothetical protein